MGRHFLRKTEPDRSRQLDRPLIEQATERAGGLAGRQAGDRLSRAGERTLLDLMVFMKDSLLRKMLYELDF